MAKRKKQKPTKSQHTHTDTADVTPEILSIAGNQVQLNVKERDLSPFFKALLDKNRSLPKHVSFYCVDAPTMSEVIAIVGIAVICAFIPGLATLIGAFLSPNHNLFVFFLACLFFFGFVWAIYGAHNKYRAVKDYEAGKYRYGLFICRYALFVRHKGGHCQLFPKHQVLDVEGHAGKRPKSNQIWSQCDLSYKNENGEKTQHQLFTVLGTTTKVEQLRAWIQQPLDHRPLVNALEAKDATLRLQAADLLKTIGWTPQDQKQQALYLLAHQNWVALKEMGADVPLEILLKRLRDHDPAVRIETAQLLAHLGWRPDNTSEHVSYFLAEKRWDTFLVLGAPTTPDLFLRELGNDAPAFQEEIANTLADLYASVERVVFDERQKSGQPPHFTLYNPDVSDLRFPMKQLQRIQIAAETHDFQLVERFVTYAMNVIGRRHLKQQVEAHLYGNPDKLHPNLQNLFNKLCKSVDIHEKVDELRIH